MPSRILDGFHSFCTTAQLQWVGSLQATDNRKTAHQERSPRLFILSSRGCQVSLYSCSQPVDIKDRISSRLRQDVVSFTNQWIREHCHAICRLSRCATGPY
ncbi:hypothetical protein BaRGS_00024996 [Batillaria attramentaria]|uniref:Uncharacterized protein n=1 Tax=Batillaria attramentaria TaxID=370345 RepID=A0ABD0K9L5_9CAEN